MKQKSDSDNHGIQGGVGAPESDLAQVKKRESPRFPRGYTSLETEVAITLNRLRSANYSE